MTSTVSSMVSQGLLSALLLPADSLPGGMACHHSPTWTRNVHLLHQQSKGKTLSRHQSWACPFGHCLVTVPEKLLLFWQGAETSMKTCPRYGLKAKEAEAFLPAQKYQVPGEGKAIADRRFHWVPSSRTVRYRLYSETCDSLRMLQAKILPPWCMSSIVTGDLKPWPYSFFSLILNRGAGRENSTCPPCHCPINEIHRKNVTEPKVSNNKDWQSDLSFIWEDVVICE